MLKWRLKACPRCGGDTYIDREVGEGWYQQCILCAYSLELKEVQYGVHTRRDGQSSTKSRR